MNRVDGELIQGQVLLMCNSAGYLYNDYCFYVLSSFILFFDFLFLSSKFHFKVQNKGPSIVEASSVDIRIPRKLKGHFLLNLYAVSVSMLSQIRLLLRFLKENCYTETS